MSGVLDTRRGYALCAVGRSGSSWFMALLAGTGALGRPEEAFNTPIQRVRLGPGYPADRRAQARYAALDCATPNGVYGLKITALHLSRLAGHIRWTEALPDLRFVHWRRRDLLAEPLVPVAVPEPVLAFTRGRTLCLFNLSDRPMLVRTDA